MEASGNWPSFPSMLGSFNQDLAIRRFCPARLEQQHQQGSAAGGGSWDHYYAYAPEFPDLQDHEDEAAALFLTLHEINQQLICRSSPVLPHDHQHLIATTPPLPASASEEDHFVDSFFNLEYSYVDEGGSPDDQYQRPYDPHDLQEYVADHEHDFSVTPPNDDAIGYGELPMMIEGDEFEMISRGSCEDTHFFSSDLMAYDHHSTTEEMSQQGVNQGLHLVHLLLACAEAVGCRDTQLAGSILSQIWSYANPWGDSLQRVSYCFAMGLNSRLSLLHDANSNGTFINGATDVSTITAHEKTEAFALLHQTTPYISFGFLAANDAICQAAKGHDSLHILDLGMEHSLQWPSLIRKLASRTEGPPKLVRFTGIVGNADILELKSSMIGIVGEANLLGISVKFHMIAGPATPSLLTRENLNLREEETLYVNSIAHLHTYVKESRGSLKTILGAIKKLDPTLLTVVEQDGNHNGPFFLGRFLESLHYYSAIFDSLEASLARNSIERMKIEKIQFAEEIRNIVACEGTDRIERHERADQWRRQLGRAGFQAVGLKATTTAQARTMVLSAHTCDGYTVASEKGCLLLGWKGRPIMLASAWQVLNNNPNRC